jgi:branched-subunit amino acid transport protein AzlD
MASTFTDRLSGGRLLRLYPGWWRARYGDEMAELLAARPANVRSSIDLVRGAFDAHLRGAEPGSGPGWAIAAALIAGGAWTIAGIASVGALAPPDWPGYLATTLPVTIVGVLAMVVAILAVARFAWASNGLTVEVAVGGVVVGHAVWAGLLALAAVGGPYGAVTAIGQSMAAIATVGIGLVLFRAGAHPIGELVVVAGAVMLIPSPAAWVVAGALWTGIGLWQAFEARSPASPPATMA